MKTIKMLLVTGFISAFASCSSEWVVMGSKTDKNQPSSQIILNALGDGNLMSVEQSVQDSVVERIRMDMHPDKVRFAKTAQVIRKDMPTIDFSSVRFFPTLSVAEKPGNEPGGNALTANKHFACLQGKDEAGERYYMIARYEDYSRKKLDVDSPPYKAAVERGEQKEFIEGFRQLQSRRGVECWRLTVLNKEDILFQTMDYACRQADNGSFFILKRKHGFDVCFVKNGEVLSCIKVSEHADIEVKKVRL